MAGGCKRVSPDIAENAVVASQAQTAARTLPTHRWLLLLSEDYVSCAPQAQP